MIVKKQSRDMGANEITTYYSPSPVENKFEVFFSFLKHYFGLNPLETMVNGSSLATELTNISDYLLLVYQTALFEPLNNYRQEKGMLSLLMALFSDIDPPNLNQRVIG